MADHPSSTASTSLRFLIRNRLNRRVFVNSRGVHYRYFVEAGIFFAFGRDKHSTSEFDESRRSQPSLQELKHSLTRLNKLPLQWCPKVLNQYSIENEPYACRAKLSGHCCRDYLSQPKPPTSQRNSNATASRRVRPQLAG